MNNEHAFDPTTSEESVPSQPAGDVERWVASIGGGALAVLGARRGGWAGAALALLGGGLVARGVSGAGPSLSEPVMRAAEPVQRAVPGISAALGAAASVELERSITLEAEPGELYRFWRSFGKLPQIMRHLESVTELDERRSHWVAKAPAGASVEWDAEIVADQPDTLISWQSVAGADIENSGSVEFRPATGGRGTVLKVKLAYKPPAGTAGRLVAKLFGEEPAQQIAEDLRRFKMLIEAGEIATTEGQSHGKRSVAGKLLSPNS